MTDHAALSRLDPDHSAVVVIDLQEKLLPAIEARERILERTRLLLRAADVLELPVVLTSQYASGLGPVVAPIRELTSAEPADKTSFGCFDSPEFCRALDLGASGRTTLVVAGIETHICVAQTVLAALERGLDVHIMADATGSRSPDDRAIGLRRMERAGAVVSSVEMAVYECLRASDTKAFKALLPHLKERG